MEIKLYLEEGVGKAKIKDGVASQVTKEAEHVGVNLDSIEMVGVASAENYPTAMKEFFGDELYTHEKGGLIAAGKAKSFKNDENLCHRIMLLDGIAGGLLAADSYFEQGSEIPIGVLDSLHVLSHELGHCRDHELRENSLENKEQKVLSFPEGFDLDVVHHYYSRILIDEFSACFLARRYLALGHLEYQVKSDQETLQRKFQECEDLKRKSQTDPEFITDVAIASSGVLWLYLIQYTKLWAGKTGGFFEDYSIPALMFFEYGLTFDSEAMDEFLEGLASSYPNICVEEDVLERIWEILSFCAGYKFEQTERGWACYWRN